MPTSVQPSAVHPAIGGPGPLTARVAGVLRSPRATFAAIAEAPSWAAVLVLTFVITFACGAALLETEVGRLALVDQWERTALAFGQRVDDARYVELEDASQHGILYAALSAVASGPLLVFGMSLLLFAVFKAARRTATFTQVLAIVAHAGVILAVRQLIAAPLNYSRETLASPTTLGLAFSMFDESSPFARFFGIVDLFVLWWIAALAIGVSVLFHRPARSLLFMFVGTYLGLALLLTLAMVLSGGGA